MSSSKLPFDCVSLSNKFLSSRYRSFLLKLTSANKVFNDSSRAFYSLERTLPNSCCSRPFCVTVKSIIVVLADSSGENDGFGRRHVKNIWKWMLKSNCDPPTSIKLFLPLVYICFSKTGSNIGSTSFSMPSIISVFPSSMQNFKN